jgi:hypothetical protein
MIVRGDAVALKYGKPGMAPGKKDVNQALRTAGDGVGTIFLQGAATGV